MKKMIMVSMLVSTIAASAGAALAHRLEQREGATMVRTEFPKGFWDKMQTNGR